MEKKLEEYIEERKEIIRNEPGTEGWTEAEITERATEEARHMMKCDEEWIEQNIE